MQPFNLAICELCCHWVCRQHRMLIGSQGGPPTQAMALSLSSLSSHLTDHGSSADPGLQIRGSTCLGLFQGNPQSTRHVAVQDGVPTNRTLVSRDHAQDCRLGPVVHVQGTSPRTAPARTPSSSSSYLSPSVKCEGRITLSHILFFRISNIRSMPRISSSEGLRRCARQNLEVLPCSRCLVLPVPRAPPFSPSSSSRWRCSNVECLSRQVLLQHFQRVRVKHLGSEALFAA